jgi:hypothetical protein
MELQMAIQTRPDRAPCWRNMATIEVDRECGELDDILEDISFDSRLERAPGPADKLRFHLVVNGSRGADRAAMAAFALLSALRAIAEDGGLPGFQILCGAHWVESVLTPMMYADDGLRETGGSA